MKTFARVIAAGWLIAIPATFVCAADLPARGPIPFATYDTNKDGAISPEEFYTVRGERMSDRAQAGMPMRGAANAPAFEAFDSDKDGRLTEAELWAGQGMMSQQRPGQAERPPMGPGMAPGRPGTPGGPGMGPGMGPGRGQGPGQGPAAVGRNPPPFSDYDLDGDGKLSRQEFEAGRSERIQERAQQGGQMRNLPNAPAFADIDTDGDGTITAEEFSAHQAQRRGTRPGRP